MAVFSTSIREIYLLSLYRPNITMGSLGPGDPALVRCRAEHVITIIERRASGQQGVRQGRTAVIGQRADQSIPENNITGSRIA